MNNVSEILHDLRVRAKAEEPAEKAKIVDDMNRTARELQARGSDHADGRGQKIGSIPARLYFRWQNMLPGCWQDRQFVHEFLQDNPQCAAPGFRPDPRSVRNVVIQAPGAVFYHANKMNAQ